MPVEQVIDVPKISDDSIQPRIVDCDLRYPQIVEQLVEVPTLLSFASLQQQTAEHIVDIPVPHGRWGSGGGGLRGFLPEQNSTVFIAEQLVHNPVRSGGLRGFHPVQGSTVFGGAEHLVLGGSFHCTVFFWSSTRSSSRFFARTEFNSGSPRWRTCWWSIAISRAVVNHDGGIGTAPDPFVWSAGALPERRRLVHAVRDRAFLPGPPALWDSEWVNIPASAFCAEDIAHWPYPPGLVVKWVSFLGALHWPADGLDLGVGGISYVELLILHEPWAGERLSLEKAHPRYLRPGRPISVSAVPLGPGIDNFAFLSFHWGFDEVSLPAAGWFG